MRTQPALAFLPFLVSLLPAQTFVRTHDEVGMPHGTPAANPAPGGGAGPSVLANPTALCGTIVPVADGTPVPGAGALSQQSFFNPSVANRAGAIAFFSNLTGATRNQGILVADANGVHPIAIGCGNGGGSGQHGTCGDPSPLGGTFGGFFGGTMFAPSINDRGDVLFLADLVNASSSRGLFLYQAATATIVKVAAVGDPSPLGGTFLAVGPGSVNTYGEVAFLAATTTPAQADVFLWSGGSTSVVAAVGQTAPGGGVFAMIATESLGFVDGTTMPVGPAPAINDCGQITFRGVVQGGQAGSGLFVHHNGVTSSYLRAGDPTPIGGTFLAFQGAAINGRGEIAFFCDYRDAANNLTSGWFAGKPGAWREVLSFYSPADGGQVYGLAYSRNPMRSIDDQGNVAMWINLSTSGNAGRIVVVAPNGTLEVLARQNGPTGIGGTYGTLDAWPSLDSTGRATINGGVIAGTVTSPHLIGQLCGPVLAASPCAPPGGTTTLDNTGDAADAFVLFAALTATNLPLPPFGTLEIGPGGVIALYGPVFYPGFGNPHVGQLALPPNPGLVGVSLYFQSLRLTGNQLLLTNSATTTLR